MKALVVGGTGFVGMNLTRALVARGDDVLATRRKRANTLFARRLGANLVTAELDSEAELTSAMTGRDVVFMCAGHYPRYSLDRAAEVDVARRRAIASLSAARRAGVERLVLVSSAATVGPPRGGRTQSDETDAPDPRSRAGVYHSVKIAIEEELLNAAAGGPEVVVLCPGAIFGELDVKAGTGFLIVAIANEKLPFCVEGRTSVVDADDLALALIAAAERGRAGERYALGGHNMLVSELVDGIAEVLQIAPRFQRLPLAVAGFISTLAEMRAAVVPGAPRPFLSRELVDNVRFGRWLDDTKAHTELGLLPSTPLNETLEKACRWYARHHYLKGLEHADHLLRSNQERPGHDHSAHPARRAR